MSPSAVMWSPLLFGFALFLSSGLLFIVQPMLGRTLLPHLGGNALAWNACLVFFQATLLAGYIYAELLHRFRGLRWQPWLQLLLMTLAIVLCFVGIFGDRMLNDLAPRLQSIDTSPVFSTICLLIVVIGMPFFALSAIGPLVQRWFTHLDHPKSSDPYFLFVASNLGGLMGLLVYTLMIEPVSPLYAQWMSWKLAVTALGVVLFLTAFCVWRSPRSLELEPPETPTDPNAPLVPRLIGRGPATWPRRLYWFIASAIPVGLMMGVTSLLTLDVAPAVIFWAVPLALYLVAFSLEFARFSPFDHGSFGLRLSLHIVFGMILVAVLALLLLMLFRGPERELNEDGEVTFVCFVFFALMLLVPSIWLPVLQPLSALAVVFVQANMFMTTSGTINSPAILLYLTCFYWSARLCLSMLAKDRPAAPALTTYYIWIAMGGLSGGLFQLILAPWLFPSGYREYAFLAALACTLRPAWLPYGLSDWILCRFAFGKRKDAEATASPWPSRIALAFDFGLAFAVASVALVAFFLRGATQLNPGRPGGNQLTAALLTCLNDFPLLIALVLATGLFLRPLRFGLALTAIVALCFIGLDSQGKNTVIVAQRNAFGILRVTEETTNIIDIPDLGKIRLPRNIRERRLRQGTVTQGNCFTEPSGLLRCPATYYHRLGPVGQVMRKLEWFEPTAIQPKEHGFWSDNTRSDARLAASLIGIGAMGGPMEQMTAAWSEPPYAVIGLGTGTLYAYAHPFQWVDSYELDPAIVALSTHQPPVFHHYQAATERGVQGKIFAGDARRNLSRPGRAGFYHVIFVDAFNSNAVPVHLLTQEAIELYFQKLAPEGVVCIHTSNRHLELALVLERLAQHLNLSIRVLHSGEDLRDGSFFASEWVVLARDELVMQRWAKAGGFKNDGLAPQGRIQFSSRLLWTDEHASVLAAIRSERGAGAGWPRLIYGMLIMMLFFGIFLGLIEIAASMMTAPAAKPADARPTRK